MKISIGGVKDQGPIYACLMFFQAIPGTNDKGRYEVVRVVSSMPEIKRMINAMCRTLEYYPTKEEAGGQ